jgi:hypothetical protein
MSGTATEHGGIPYDWYREGSRCEQIGGSRRHGTLASGLWGGYVSVLWDSGRLEHLVHIRDIRKESSPKRKARRGRRAGTRA